MDNGRFHVNFELSNKLTNFFVFICSLLYEAVKCNLILLLLDFVIPKFNHIILFIYNVFCTIIKLPLLIQCGYCAFRIKIL